MADTTTLRLLAEDFERVEHASGYVDYRCRCGAIWNLAEVPGGKDFPPADWLRRHLHHNQPIPKPRPKEVSPFKLELAEGDHPPSREQVLRGIRVLGQFLAEANPGRSYADGTTDVTVVINTSYIKIFKEAEAIISLMSV